ncbi:interleukin 15, like isoform X2 [Garra rufa]|uniref:interleukin 15, like isoform X2 n=1 Tax=Garra rufa TaxID=137080 RepID=UPI003CCEACE5
MTDGLVRESWIFDMRTDLLHCSMRFTSLFLYLLIILTRQRQIKCQAVCSKESVEMVKRIAGELSKVKNDIMLYTPTLADYEKCSKSTLMCFALEVNVLFAEIKSVAKSQSVHLLRILRMLTSRDKMKPCPVCEHYREERAETFLETLQNVSQWINAESCVPRTFDRNVKNFMEKTLKT